jgi:hypothetical protein
MNLPKQCRKAFRLALAVFFCLIATVALANAQAAPSLKIVVIQGEGARNNIALGATQQLIVQVRDENDKPVAGASVTFYSPERGPGGSFFGAYNKLTVSTNEQGNAAATSFQPNLLEGPFQIRVIASLDNRMGEGVINQSNFLQTNVLPTETGSPGLIARLRSVKVSPRTKKIAVITAGALIALIVTTRGGDTPAPVPGTSIIPGTISVGAPR